MGQILPKMQKKEIFQFQIPNSNNKLVQESIVMCISYQQNYYNRFLITKIGLKEIKHRKIVHKIYQKYVPNKYRLVLHCAYMNNKSQKQNIQCIKDIGYCMKLLYNLQDLQLYLQNNNFGVNTMNMKYLSELMKELPSSLQNFELYLHGNNLGVNSDNIRYLGEGIKQLPNNLKYILLDLMSNNLRNNTDNIKRLGNCMKQLPYNLQELQMYLFYNDLEENQVQQLEDEIKNSRYKQKKLQIHFQ